MRFRSLILMVLAVLCTSQVMAQSKRNVRKRPATNRTVVNPHCSHPLCNSLISNIRIF